MSVRKYETLCYPQYMWLGKEFTFVISHCQHHIHQTTRASHFLSMILFKNAIITKTIIIYFGLRPY